VHSTDARVAVGVGGGSYGMVPFVRSALDRNEWSVSRAGCFTHGTYGVGGGEWARELCWAFWRGEKCLAKSGNRSPDRPARGIGT